MKLLFFAVIISLTLISFFLIITPNNVYATPIEDLRGETLTQGKFNMRGSSDPSVEDYINLLLYQKVTITIDKDGKVSGTGAVSFSDTKWFSNYLFTGDASFFMQGNYDVKTHRFNGTFSVQHHNTSDDLTKDSPLGGSYTMNYNGKFTGGQSAKTGAIVFDFSGTKSQIGNTTRMDGTVEEFNKSEKWNHQIAFNDFVIGEKMSGGLIRGTAQLSRGDGWVDINKNKTFAVQINDTLKTGPNTRMLIRYKDGSIFVLKSNSQLTILQNGVSLKYGDSTYILMKKQKEFKVITKTTVAGVLGTTFNVSYNTETQKSVIELMKGSIFLQTTTDEKHLSVLKPGDKVEVSPKDYIKNNFDYNQTLETIKKEIANDSQKINFETFEDQEEKTETANNFTVTNQNKPITSQKSWFLIFIVIIIIIGFGIIILRRIKQKGNSTSSK